MIRGAWLSRDSTSAGRWNTTAGGGRYAIGVGGAITGRGANVLIIDDALHDGLSEAERETAWRWYTEVAIPRLEPGGAVIVIGARFADVSRAATAERRRRCRSSRPVSARCTAARASTVIAERADARD